MQNINFPLKFVFNVTSLANDFTATDVNGETVGYVRQKMFKLKEDINIYSDKTRENIEYTIKADRWLDFSASYTFRDKDGTELGKIGRKGWASLWKAHYEIFDQNQELQYTVREENAWVKVLDGLLGEIPILGMFMGYIFNPSYIVTDNQGQTIVRLKKEPSMLGRRFQVDKVGALDNDDDDRILLGLMMMILLERRRG
ncbi:MAG: hypothetical protein AB8F95_22840 [Bacteroidia bacterium]